MKIEHQYMLIGAVVLVAAIPPSAPEPDPAPVVETAPAAPPAPEPSKSEVLQADMIDAATNARRMVGQGLRVALGRDPTLRERERERLLDKALTAADHNGGGKGGCEQTQGWGTAMHVGQVNGLDESEARRLAYGVCGSLDAQDAMRRYDKELTQ